MQARRIWRTVPFILVLFIGMAFSAGPALGQDAKLSSTNEKESYSLGYQFGENMKSQKFEISVDAYVKGFQDALGGKKAQLEQEEMRKVLMELRQKMMVAQQKSQQEQSAKNLEAGKAFLEENAKKPGVITTASGLQYKVIKEGSGNTPKKEDTVTVNYRGTLIDGTEFDSSYARNEPATFPVSGVIPGWTEALQLMKEGSKWELFIPPSLAYGERGMGGRIGPNSTLIFEVELLSINKETKPQ